MHKKGARAEFDALLESAWQAQQKQRKWAADHSRLASQTPKEVQSKLPTGDRLAVLLALGGGGLAIMLVLLHLTPTSTLVLLFLLFAMWFYPILYFVNVFFVKLTSIIVSAALLVIVVATIGVIEWPPRSLVDMSNQELKQAERRLANNIRNLEFSTDSEVINSMSSHDPFIAMRAEARMQADFRKKYLPDASAMRCELLRREDEPCAPVVSPLYLGDFRLMAFTGQLVGPSPLNNAADYLDELANKLQY